jgi:hypothetical protein
MNSTYPNIKILIQNLKKNLRKKLKINCWNKFNQIWNSKFRYHNRKTTKKQIKKSRNLHVSRTIESPMNSRNTFFMIFIHVHFSTIETKLGECVVHREYKSGKLRKLIFRDKFDLLIFINDFAVIQVKWFFFWNLNTKKSPSSPKHNISFK